MRLEYLTFTVAKRIEHELFYRPDNAVDLRLQKLTRPTPGQSRPILTKAEEKELKEAIAAYCYGLAESVIEELQNVYEGSHFH